jgi:hypothetical protein
VSEPGTSLWPRAAGAATVAASVSGTAMLCYLNGWLTIPLFPLLTLCAGIPLAFAHIGLVAPQIAKPIIGKGPLLWEKAALVGLLSGIGPIMLFMAVRIPLLLATGYKLIGVDEWVLTIAVLGLAGAIGGIAFRAVHGEGPL